MVPSERKAKPAASDEARARLRSLAHELSNSVETILQASYLLNQGELDGDSKKWVKLIDTAAQDTARINRQIRDLLRADSEG